MKKLMFTFAALCLIGLGLFFFTREEHLEAVQIKTVLCENGAPSCHGDGVRRYKTMTPLSIFGAVLVGVSVVGGAVVVSRQRAKKHPKKR